MYMNLRLDESRCFDFLLLTLSLLNQLHTFASLIPSLSESFRHVSFFGVDSSAKLLDKSDFCLALILTNFKDCILSGCNVWMQSMKKYDNTVKVMIGKVHIDVLYLIRYGSSSTINIAR